MLKREIKWVVGVLILCIMVLLSIVFYQMGKQKGRERIAVDFTVSEDTEEEIGNWKYQFLKKEMSDYICALCTEMEIDPDLIVAILMKENPEFDPEATHKNDNGTIDVGMFQLNDRYVWTTFKDTYCVSN